MDCYQSLTNEQMMQIIGEVDFCYLGFRCNSQPYIYPMYFANELEDEELVFYVRTLTDGLLLNSMNCNDDVCLLFSYGINGVVSTVLALCEVEICKEEGDAHGSTLLRCKVCSMTGRAYTIAETT